MNRNEEPLPIRRHDYMNTLTDCIKKVVNNGYTDNYKITNKGLFSGTENRHFQPEQVRIINFYRFEGQTDPSDNTILYVIETDSGSKGTLVDAYGPYADEEVNRFIRAVENINKKSGSQEDKEANY